MNEEQVHIRSQEYHDTICQQKICHCTNGTHITGFAAAGSSCPKHNAIKCIQCQNGEQPINGLCFNPTPEHCQQLKELFNTRDCSCQNTQTCKWIQYTFTHACVN